MPERTNGGWTDVTGLCFLEFQIFYQLIHFSPCSIESIISVNDNFSGSVPAYQASLMFLSVRFEGAFRLLLPVDLLPLV